MAELWIALTLFAAFMQNLRSVLQKSLKGELGTAGATFVRFLYALPVVALYLFALHQTGHEFRSPGHVFWLYASVGGLAQIAGTAFLVALFDQRSFAVATTYSKTETVQAAIFAIAFLGETTSALALVGIAVSLVGVVIISVARRGGAAESSTEEDRSWRMRATLFGLASGASFGLAAVCYRGASLSLGGEGFLVQSATTLFWVLLFQTLSMGTFMGFRAREELTACLRTWRVSSLVGLSGALASAGWFAAMTLQNAALVRAVGQVELIFTLASSALLFGERILKSELVGIAAVTLGILILLGA